MFERKVSLPDMILFAGTRVALGVGIGMLVSKNLSNDARKATGLALTAVGAFTTIPLVMAIINSKANSRMELAA
jgi:hypothetical protein